MTITLLVVIVAALVILLLLIKIYPWSAHEGSSNYHGSVGSDLVTVHGLPNEGDGRSGRKFKSPQILTAVK